MPEDKKNRMLGKLTKLIGQEDERLPEAIEQPEIVGEKQPDVDFTSTVEALKTPGATLNKGMEQVLEGDVLTGALNVGLGMAHTAFLPISLPFVATTDVIRSGGRVLGIEDITEPVARTFEVPFEVPGVIVEEGQKLIDAGLEALGVDTKQTDQAIIFDLQRRGLLSADATPEELAETLTEVNKLGLTVLGLKAIHKGVIKSKGGKTVEQPVLKTGKKLEVETVKKYATKKDIAQLKPRNEKGQFTTKVIEKPQEVKDAKIKEQETGRKTPIKEQPVITKPKVEVKERVTQREGEGQEVRTEQDLITKPRDKAPAIISNKIKEDAEGKLEQIERATKESAGAFRRQENIGEGFETTRTIGAFTISDFPDWFASLGRNKKDVVNALKKIIEDKGKDRGKLVEDVKAVILEHLKEGEDISTLIGQSGKFRRASQGKAPPDAEISEFLGRFEKGEFKTKDLDKAFAEFEKETTFKPEEFAKSKENVGQNIESLTEGGKKHLTEGVTYAEWSKKMVSEFGDKVKPQLLSVWSQVKEKPVTGERKVRGFAKSTERRVMESGLLKEIKDLPTYVPKRDAPRIAEATKITANDFERAKRIAFGLETHPTVEAGFFHEAVRLVSQKSGDFMLDIELAKSKISVEATEAGQFIQALKDHNPLSSVRAIKEIVKERVSKVKDVVVKKIKKETEASFKRVTRKNNLKFKDWNSFIKSIQCI